MATPKQLEFSSSGGDSNGFSPSRRKSSRKPFSKRHASENNEIFLLHRDQWTIELRVQDPKPKLIGITYRFMGGSIRRKFSKEQLCSKTKKLKRKFLLHMEKINEGNDPPFTRSSDSEAFEFSMMIWPINDPENTNGGIDKAEQTKKDDEEWF